MQEFVTTLLLAAHLLAMNVSSAGPLVGAWLMGRRGAGDDGGRELGRRVVRLSLVALVVGSLIGGGLILAPNPALRAALARFPEGAYWFAGLELLFSAGCIGALMIGDWAPRFRRLALGVALLSATNLLYHFPPMMAVIGELTANPRWATDERIDRDALLRLWVRPEILSLWTHFALASLAVASIAALRPWSRRDSKMAPTDPAVVKRLGMWALTATVLQIPVGLWLLASTAAEARESMLGSNLLTSLCFAGGVLAALGLLQTLLMMALGDDEGAVRRAGCLLVVVTVLMSATMRTSRTATPEPVRRSNADASLPSTEEVRLESLTYVYLAFSSFGSF
ncbi:MAG: hypothetical protein H0T51_13845 [Pirellulales bacterium]|nr:hypothetical protein [Pirellulales bacterium]